MRHPTIAYVPPPPSTDSSRFVSAEALSGSRHSNVSRMSRPSDVTLTGELDIGNWCEGEPRTRAARTNHVGYAPGTLLVSLRPSPR